MSHTTTVLGTTNPDMAASVFWVVVAGAVELVAVIRTVRLPAPAWSYGRWSKAAAIVAAGWLVARLGVVSVPVGAVAVIWHTRTLARRATALQAAPDLPMAAGRDETEECGK